MSDITRYWNEDALEPRDGQISAVDGWRFRVKGCAPRRGDWIQLKAESPDRVDALVLEARNGWLECFPFFRLSPTVGDAVSIIGTAIVPP